MIESDYAAPYERALDSHEYLASELYWLAVRAGVVGRRAERADVLDLLNASAIEAEREEGHNYAEACRPASAYLDNLSYYIEHGEHLGAARRSKR